MTSLVASGKGIYLFNVASGDWAVLVTSSGINFDKYNGTNYRASYSTPLNLSQWYHIAATASTTAGMKLYLNGSEVASDSFTGTINLSYNDIGWGYYNDYADRRGFSGLIDQGRIFPSALTADQVAMLYAENEGATKFDDGTDTTLVFKGGTGTINLTDTSLPGPKVGDLRTNTDQISGGSASAMEHYMSTGWRIFTNVIIPPYNIEYLLAAGGGWAYWGGGGGGSVTQTTNYGGSASPITTGTGTVYTITVPLGGSGIRTTSATPANGGDATITATGFTTISAAGGGQGGGADSSTVSITGYNGGSGGGGGIITSTIGVQYSGGTGSDGGSGGPGLYNGTPILAGGGGGASGANGVGWSSGSQGGNGETTTIIDTTTATSDSVGEVNSGSIYFGGGGGGGSRNYGDVSRGGLGGGGDGEQLDGSSTQQDGAANTGGGCGAVGSSTTTTTGGSGCIILRMLTSNFSGSTTGGPLQRTIGVDTILIYKTSGTYTS